MQLLRLGAIVNHLSVSRQGSTADGTTPLHACAVMKLEDQVASDHYLECARVLMLSGGNPYQENASGKAKLYCHCKLSKLFYDPQTSNRHILRNLQCKALKE